MKVKEIVTKNSETLYMQLVEIRHKQGLYSVDELAKMFGVQKSYINYAINLNRIKYISPNTKVKYIYLNDFVEYMKQNSK